MVKVIEDRALFLKAIVPIVVCGVVALAWWFFLPSKFFAILVFLLGVLGGILSAHAPSSRRSVSADTLKHR
jgi:hypothetical protein